MEENMEKQTEQQNDGSQGQEERLFTQAEVDRIVAKRLSREKADGSENLKERENSVAQREALMDAREMIADAGLPKELLDVIDYRDKAKVEKAVEVAKQLLKSKDEQTQEKPKYRISTSSSRNYGSGSSKTDDVRRAMGLRG